MAYSKIVLKQVGGSRRFQAKAAAGTILPGYLVYMTNAAADTVAIHATASGNVCPVMVAVEDSLQGKGITDLYTSGAQVQCEILLPGDVFYGMVADGQNIAKGDLLESAGAGTLQKYTADSTGIYYPKQIVGQALEAVDMSSSAGADPSGRICVVVG
jgi:hypothetical protein